MRKVFISYSIEDRNLHLITLLLEHLRKNNYDVIVSNYGMDSTMRIVNANLFIGIVTNNSKSINFVIEEWRVAKKNGMQNILIIEDGVRVNDSRGISYIRFNRSNPQEAIDKLFKINKPVANTPQKKKDNTDTVSDALIGVAVIAGVAALLSLLSKND